MKQFNKTISVEVSVDSIANNLLSNMKEDFKHKELVVEAIIGSALEKGGLGYIYNSLNGFNNEINFQVGDAVISTDRTYLGTKDETGKVERNHQEIGPCSVKEINIYADRKLLVEYSTYNRSGEFVVEQEWVYHKNCSKASI